MLVLVLLAACQAPVPTVAPIPAPRLPVIASFSILADLVRNVGGDRVEVTSLVGPGQDAHTFEPAPSHGVALARARLVFENGLGFEGWLDKMYNASGSKARRVVLTDGITAQEGGQAHVDGAAEEAHAAGESDPHVWQDVKHSIHMVGAIRDALVQADPSGAAAYRSNAETYIAELQALDDWIVEQVSTLPEPRRTLVTNHDTLGYFASRYGFAIVGTAVSGVSTETSEPSAAELASIIRRIKSAGVPAIFAENVANPKVVERIAQEAGVKVAPSLYTDALARPGEPVDTYVRMMRYNVSTIVTALKA